MYSHSLFFSNLLLNKSDDELDFLNLSSFLTHIRVALHVAIFTLFVAS